MRPTQVVLTALLISGCAGMRGGQLDESYGEPQPRNRVTATAAAHPVDYWRDVKPVLDSLYPNLYIRNPRTEAGLYRLLRLRSNHFY